MQAHEWVERTLLSGKIVTSCRHCGVLKSHENALFICHKRKMAAMP